MNSAKIFVAFGTHEQPYFRLMQWAQAMSADGKHLVSVQHGYTPLPGEHKFVSVSELIPYDQFLDRISECDLFVTQASPGMIYSSLESGTPTIVVPREARFKEHVDDHQIYFASHLESVGVAQQARTLDALLKMVVATLDDSADIRLRMLTRRLHESRQRTNAFVVELRDILNAL